MTVKRFNFEDFTEGHAGEVIKTSIPTATTPLEPDAPEPPLPPAINKEDLERAKADGVTEGRAKGYAEGKQEVLAAWEAEKAATETLLASLMESLHTKLNTLFSTAESEKKLPASDILTRLCLAIAQKIAGNALQTHATSDIEGFIRHSLDQLFDEPKLTIYVAEPLCEPLRHRIELLGAEQNFHGSLYVQPDTLLGPSDCRIEWHDGYICHSQAEITTHIEKILNISSTPSSTDTEVSNSM